MRYKVVGPPGTGKTKTLLDKVKMYLDTGISLEIKDFIGTRFSLLSLPKPN